MATIAAATKVKWNEIAKVGLPPKELQTTGINSAPRTFLVRGEWSIFTSNVFDDGSGFEAEGDDVAVAWAVIDGH